MRLLSAAATPTIRLAVEMRPSLALRRLLGATRQRLPRWRSPRGVVRLGTSHRLPIIVVSGRRVRAAAERSARRTARRLATRYMSAQATARIDAAAPPRYSHEVVSVPRERCVKAGEPEGDVAREVDGPPELSGKSTHGQRGQLHGDEQPAPSTPSAIAPGFQSLAYGIAMSASPNET